jgi:hypothetical protein
MSADKEKKMSNRRKWNEADRQAFADGNRTKAQTFRDRKKEANRKECRGFRWNG